MSIFINPGTEPLPTATEDNARRAVDLFVADAAERYGSASWDDTFRGEDRGRWTCGVIVAGYKYEIEMPGIDPAVTREGTPWVSPRLYVDGSSWLWQYALNVVDPADRESDEDDEDDD